MGIEPTYPAWKAGVLPLNYTRKYLFFRSVLRTVIIIQQENRNVNTFLKKIKSFYFCYNSYKIELSR